MHLPKVFTKRSHSALALGQYGVIRLLVGKLCQSSLGNCDPLSLFRVCGTPNSANTLSITGMTSLAAVDSMIPKTGYLE